MAEPMSSGEIEDVLSSIRRLVSEDFRPAAKTDTAAPLRPKPDDKLLLTPAFRVVARPVSRPQAEMTDAAVTGSAAPEDDIVAVAPDTEDTLVLGDGFSDADEGTDASDSVDGAWAEEAAADDAEGDHAEADDAPSGRLDRVVSEIGAAVADNGDDWESETGDPVIGGASWQASDWVEEAELVDDPADDRTPEAETAIADAAEAAAVAEILGFAAQNEVKTPPKPAKAEVPDEEGDAEGGEGGYFDEAVLRDLVRDLIREELSGSLGERITRNVRKLVRSEVNRALAVREIE
ncbi:hypothetical protein [Pseudorhodobacter sp.]|uniref:hypothetical protein n=1 Tax=Pseudorhodobacter sp. TaxID=1934400 RepID=UPI0026495060|nr:hypothetical protein [Pseudorhodobacter sp.]MDN5787146.1 hypothetical protein [Pseudorhodobacter sp.]